MFRVGDIVIVAPEFHPPSFGCNYPSQIINLYDDFAKVRYIKGPLKGKQDGWGTRYLIFAKEHYLNEFAKEI